MLNIKNTRQYTLKNNEPSINAVGITGFSAVIIQCVLLRELLSVFFGNELILGILLCVWLLSCGTGSYLGNRFGFWNSSRYTILLLSSTITGLLVIRWFPLLFEKGSAIPIFGMAGLAIAAEAPAAFLCGYIFGAFSRISSKPQRIYSLENGGALLGSVVVYLAILLDTANAGIIIVALAPLPLIPILDRQEVFVKKAFRSGMLFLFCLIVSALILKTDKKSASAKYAGDISAMQYTREGEIATMVHGPDTTILLNNRVYRSTLDNIVAEQAVHIPAAQRRGAKTALVVFDRGHSAELAKYKGLVCVILETLPAVASSQSIITTPERYRCTTRYDLVYIGAGLPENTASNRFYTVSFLQRMKRCMTPGAVLSFTLPFGENYRQKNEQQLYTILINTLKNSFTFVVVFPGNGYSTFMASDDALFIPKSVAVQNEYLSSFIIPALSEEKIVNANRMPANTPLNKNTRPLALYFSIKNWMDTFGLPDAVLTGCMLVLFLGALAILPKTKAVLSVTSSGFATGFYSIGIMLLYQGTYGSLYAGISLLLIALSLGFAAGSRLTRLPFSDSILGVYAVFSFFALSSISQPPVLLFLLCHFGIGFLSAGQFVTRKNTPGGILNTADCIGGVFGMALSSTLLVPLFGIIPVALGVALLKVAVEISNRIHH